MSLAGLNGALIDRGGQYRTRAITMSVLALASATARLIATAVAGHLALAVPVAFAVAFACGMVRVWPDIGAGFGVTVLVTFAISLPIMAFLTYTRRFAASTSALALAASTGDRTTPDALSAFSIASDQILDDLADAVANGRPPAPFPAIGTVVMPDDRASAAVRARINRLARQLRMLDDSVERWFGEGRGAGG